MLIINIMKSLYRLNGAVTVLLFRIPEIYFKISSSLSLAYLRSISQRKCHLSDSMHFKLEVHFVV